MTDCLPKTAWPPTWGQSPRISELAEQNKIIAYNYPQGVLTQTLRAAAAHQPGIISDIGIGTFVDQVGGQAVLGR
ncbi:CoA-transferase, partial [Pseudomonas aeruginosa]|uniref:CoA-transferase n=1 Tax=Pseudomonas aeruginosa TaxID=287 RepID=UPI003014BB4A